MSVPSADDSISQHSPRLIPGVLLPSGIVTPGRRGARSLRLRNAIVASSFELDGMRVLDVGCAEGRQSLYMAARAAEVWGVDHRMSEIEIARATASALRIKNVRFEAGDVRDPDLFKDIGKFDLAIAWGFLHRITDIFALFYALEPITNAISLEWRTPVLPMMADLGLAYHPTKAAVLDPMNTGRKADPSDAGSVTDKDKVEGSSAFWEPTPGAVKAMLNRLGYTHHTLLGYGEDLQSQEAVMKLWRDHETGVRLGRRSATNLPEARVHMLFEKRAGSIRLATPAVAKSRVPAWDYALVQHMQKADMAKSRASTANVTTKAVGILKKIARRVPGLSRFARRPSKKRGANRKSGGGEKSDSRNLGYGKLLRGEIRKQARAIAADAATPLDTGGASPSNGRDVQISEIDFSKLTVVTYRSKQLTRYLARGQQLPRAVFRDDRYYYKVWRHDYRGHQRVGIGTDVVTVPAIDANGIERLWGFHSGLFDEELCPAYVGGIYNGTRLVGYRTLVGQEVTEFPLWRPKYRRFVDALAKNTWQSGFAHSDFKTKNVVQLQDGRLSLIDFDGQLRALYRFSPEYEMRRGALRHFTIEAYRQVLLRFVDPSVTDPEMARTRERARSMPALLADALEGASGERRAA